MANKGCPFCGSEEITLKTPYVTRTLRGGSEAEYTYCCKAQARNHEYQSKHTNLTDGQEPSLEKISRL